MMQRLHAVWLLGWSLIRTLLAPLFGTRRGIDDFRKSYASDRLLPLTAARERAIVSSSGCIACGLCDVGEGPRRAESRGVYGGAMDLALASSRNVPDFDASSLSARVPPRGRLKELERRCPAGVPLAAIATFVDEIAEEMQERRDARASNPDLASEDSNDGESSASSREAGRVSAA